MIFVSDCHRGTHKPVIISFSLKRRSIVLGMPTTLINLWCYTFTVTVCLTALLTSIYFRNNLADLLGGWMRACFHSPWCCNAPVLTSTVKRTSKLIYHINEHMITKLIDNLLSPQTLSLYFMVWIVIVKCYIFQNSYNIWWEKHSSLCV